MEDKLIHIVLTTAGNLNPNPKGTPKTIVWDTENDDPRRKLHKAAGKEKDRVIDRMLNPTARIGHNKFAVYVKDGTPTAVMTGSTNCDQMDLEGTDILQIEAVRRTTEIPAQLRYG